MTAKPTAPPTKAIKMGNALRDPTLKAREPHSLEQSRRDESPPMAREAKILRLFEQLVSARRIHAECGRADHYEVGAQHAIQHCGGAQDR